MIYWGLWPIGPSCYSRNAHSVRCSLVPGVPLGHPLLCKPREWVCLLTWGHADDMWGCQGIWNDCVCALVDSALVESRYNIPNHVPSKVTLKFGYQSLLDSQVSSSNDDPKKCHWLSPRQPKGSLCASLCSGPADGAMARCRGHLWRWHRVGGSYSISRDTWQSWKALKDIKVI